MNDDIVTRLRGKEHGDYDLRCESCDSFCCHCELCDCCLEIVEVCLQAADEIESLRKQVTTWISCAERLVESNHEDYKEALGFYRDCQRIVNEEARR